MRLRKLPSAILACALAAGCGGGDEEERLARLGDELAQLREGLAETRAVVVERESAAKAAQDALASARGEQRDQEKRIAQIEKELGKHATDPVLFRLVQKQLLEDAKLEPFAISARVDRGVVTLSGVVKDEKLRARAVELAQSVPGVLSVQDRMQVSEPPKPAG
jgi:osmotically-inducible protein OsmY